MQGLVNALNSFITWLQMPAIPLAIVAVLIGAYFNLWGGENGPRNAKKWWIGTAVFLVVVYGGAAIVNSFKTNINF